MFTQDLRSFLKSKTNIIAMVGLAGSVYGFMHGYIGFSETMMAVTTNLGLMGLRDAVAK